MSGIRNRSCSATAVSGIRKRAAPLAVGDELADCGERYTVVRVEPPPSEAGFGRAWADLDVSENATISRLRLRSRLRPTNVVAPRQTSSPREANPAFEVRPPGHVGRPRRCLPAPTLSGVAAKLRAQRRARETPDQVPREQRALDKPGDQRAESRDATPLATLDDLGITSMISRITKHESSRALTEGGPAGERLAT